MIMSSNDNLDALHDKRQGVIQILCCLILIPLYTQQNCTYSQEKTSLQDIKDRSQRGTLIKN